MKTAFLNSRLDEAVCMMQPEDAMTVLVAFASCSSMFGLKQSSRNLYMRLESYLATQRLNPMPGGSCVSIRINGEDKPIVVLYLDDVLYM